MHVAQSLLVGVMLLQTLVVVLILLNGKPDVPNQLVQGDFVDEKPDPRLPSLDEQVPVASMLRSKANFRKAWNQDRVAYENRQLRGQRVKVAAQVRFALH